MGAKKIKKSKQMEKLAHGVMICDIQPRKNTKHGIPTFQRKNSSQIIQYMATYQNKKEN
jgi:hypothetical protein